MSLQNQITVYDIKTWWMMSDCTIPILGISIFCNEKSPPTVDDTRELRYAWDEAMQKV